MAEHEREELLRQAFGRVKDGPGFVLKDGKMLGTYSVINPMMPKIKAPRMERLIAQTGGGSRSRSCGNVGRRQSR